MYTNLFDSHTHSENSPDGNHSVMCMCERAVELGLSGLSITDHMEANEYEEFGYRARVQQSIFDIQKAQSLLGDRVLISCGLELGQALQNPAAAKEVLGLCDYDFVIGSLHALAGMKDFYYLDYNDPKIVIRDLVNDYYSQCIDLARWGHFDVLGHLTYPIRYIWGRARIPVDLGLYSDAIDELMRTLISNGRGIEVNTSGLRQGLGTTLPDLPLVRRYRQLGGEIITIGSDAHCAEDLGTGIEYAMDLLKEAGFRHFTFYKERQPRMLDLM